MLTPVLVEDQVVTISAALEEATERYAEVADREVRARLEYHRHYWRVVLGDVNAHPKQTASVRDARAGLLCDDDHTVWRLAEAELRAAREHLLTLRARLSAVQTLARSLAVQV